MTTVWVVLAFGEEDRAQKGEVQLSSTAFSTHEQAMQWIREDLLDMMKEDAESLDEEPIPCDDPIVEHCRCETSVIDGHIYWVYAEAFDQYYQLEEITLP
jgi:uncharacterized protein YllA (UPF0747 family)